MSPAGIGPVQDAIRNQGYAIIPDLAVDHLVSFAQGLGRPSPDIRNPSIVRDLFPAAASDSPRNTLSSRYGTGEFPFHTETAYWRVPARYVLLHCVDAGAGDRATLLLDPLADIPEEERTILEQEPWVVTYTRRPFLTTILEQRVQGRIFRYDPACMRPANGAASAIISKALRAARVASIRWRAGMLLVLDNHRVCHGRGEAGRPDPDRHLRRVLVKEEAA